MPKIEFPVFYEVRMVAISILQTKQFDVLVGLFQAAAAKTPHKCRQNLRILPTFTARFWQSV